MTTASVIWLVLCVIGSFLLCGVPYGLIIASKMAGIDVRKEGSGNIGMTNVARTAGGSAAALTFACDVGKGLVCMLVSKLLITTVGGVDAGLLVFGAPLDWMCAVVYASCVLGHVFSPYLHFRGGKGISCGFGAGLGFFWPVGLGLLAVFLAFTLPSRYISLGSVAAAVSLPIQCALWGLSPVAMVPIVLVSCAVVWSHRENIGRLVRHEERQFSIKH